MIRINTISNYKAWYRYIKNPSVYIENKVNKIVKIKCEKFDKYGRLLIDVYIPNEMKRENAKTGMLSEWLIDNQYAYEYDGGTKQNWDVISLAE